MKTDEQRGEFGVWLRNRRKDAGFKNATEAVRAMKTSAGYAISVSEWAEFEAGTRRPSLERRAALESFLGEVAPVVARSSQSTDHLAEALAAQTRAIEAQTAVLGRILGLLERPPESALVQRLTELVAILPSLPAMLPAEPLVPQDAPPEGAAPVRPRS